MFKALLLLQIAIISAKCNLASSVPSQFFGDVSISSSSPYFPEFITTDIEEIGKQEISSKRHFSKLKLKNSELFLPRNVIPISYKLHIRPILESSNPEEILTAPGSVDILVRCEVATNSITLHAHTKQFVKIFEDSLRVQLKQGDFPHNLTSRANPTATIERSFPEKEDIDFFQIQLSESLQPGEEYVVHLEFVTRISNTTLDGLYLSKYKDPISQEEKFLAVTQFEAIAARQMFPCFDEPDLKSTFHISISRAKGYNSMSNMPLEYTQPDPEHESYFVDHFSPTPQMSTYLVALVVSEFTCTTAPTFLYNKTVEACGPKHMVDQGGAIHAAQVSARILHFYEKLWGIPYPLPKMTSVAIPDFEAGAMENYGLNTYRISSILYFPGKSTEANRHGIESTIAHELAHQNFGNLVTCKSWNQIFLNEGFATFVSNLGMEEVSPEFEAEFFGWYTSYFQRALKADANPDVHPLVKAEDYFGYFDAISYSKGASLIKMMENILSRKTLFNGLSQYLKTFSFGNAQYQGLFDALDIQAKAEETHPELASMVDIMETWTIQPGFPLVRVGWIFDRLFHISQERFLRHPSARDLQSRKDTGWRVVRKDSSVPSDPNDGTRNLLWHCPIFIAQNLDGGRRSSGSNPTSQTSQTFPQHRPALWLTNKESIKAWSSKSSVDWIIVNPDSKAFFRVLYDEKLSNAIENALNNNFQVFSPITRAQLIDDAFECAWARYNSITVALGRTRFLKDETDPRVWTTILNNLKQIYAMLSEDLPSVHNFKKYLSPRVSQAIDGVGVELLPEHKGQSVLHRASLLAWGGLLELPSVQNYSRKLVEVYISESNLNLIPVDIRSEILCAAVIEGTPETTNFLLEQYKNTKNDSGVRNLLINSIGCSKSSNMIQSLLANSTNTEFLHSKKDSEILLQKLVVNPFSRSLTFFYLEQHFAGLLEYFEDPNVAARVLKTFSYFWNTEGRLAQMKELQNRFAQELEPVDDSSKLTLALIEENIGWMKHHGSEITNWLQNEVGKEEETRKCEKIDSLKKIHKVE